MIIHKERVLLISNNLWLLGEGMLGPLFAVFTERVGGNVLDISGAYATYLFVTGLLVIIVGKLSDHVSKELLMTIGYAINTIFTFAYLWISQTIHLFIVQAGLGVAAALANPTFYALYGRECDHDNDGYAWGIYDGAGRIVYGIAMVIGGVIVNSSGFDTLFIIMGTIQAIATIYTARLLWN